MWNLFFISRFFFTIELSLSVYSLADLFVDVIIRSTISGAQWEYAYLCMVLRLAH